MTKPLDREYELLVCAKDNCDTEFMPTHWRQVYCVPHKTPPNSQRYRYIREALEKGDESSVDLKPRVKPKAFVCKRQGCQKKVTGKRLASGAKYHSQECADMVHNAASANRKREQARAKGVAPLAEPSTTGRRGDVYRQLQIDGMGEDIKDGTITQVTAAELLGVTPAAVQRGYEAWLYDQAKGEAKGLWKMHYLMQAQLPQTCLEEIRELGKDERNVDTERFQEILDYLVRAYVVFSKRWFELEGERVLVEGYHIRWIRSLISNYATGGKLLILSPPRHGKSELLIRFVVWIVLMDFNTRVMWVCGNTDVAKLMLGAVKDYLENHEELIKAVLPPGEVFRPPHGGGKPWSGKELKIVQNKRLGQKSSTLLALGRTSKILSRDVDVLIVDDLEDFDTTREPGQRRYSRSKFAEIGTRKEGRTVWLDIGSRQHPDDLANYLLRTAEVGGWEVLENSAHDATCTEDPADLYAHTDCMLFPAVRDYKWLMEKKQEMEMLGIPGAYEMRYLNKPLPETGIVFDMNKIRRNALDKSRGIGTDLLPPGLLFAGLDPASRGMQAWFIWHYAGGTLSMVDLDEQQAGGFAGALRVMEWGYDEYELTDWYYEDNSQQIEFFNDPRVKELKRDLGLTIRDHTTGKNKQDPELGISSMAPFLHDGTINLPYGTAEARDKTERYLRQLELWTTDGVRSGGLTDIKMASWFPFPRLIRLMRKDRVQDRIAPAVESSYPTITTMSHFQRTKYPGGR